MTGSKPVALPFGEPSKVDAPSRRFERPTCRVGDGRSNPLSYEGNVNGGRGEDSNSRGDFSPTSFPTRSIRPLCHPTNDVVPGVGLEPTRGLSHPFLRRARLSNFASRASWCVPRDSSPHALRRPRLKRVRLPIPPGTRRFPRFDSHPAMSSRMKAAGAGAAPCMSVQDAMLRGPRMRTFAGACGTLLVGRHGLEP